MAIGNLKSAPARDHDLPERINRVVASIEGVIVGKTDQLRLSVACLLAGGHLLIEDLPGVGKTTLAHALARALGLSYHRIQFTSDMLPADVIGVSIYRRDTGEFEFHKGPVFSHVVLADEINRATPKAQSALLEAMEENQVTADGSTYDLPIPFFVIATRNPVHQVGTFPLPESQLDRFLMQIVLGYPEPEDERVLLTNGPRRTLIDSIQPEMTIESLLRVQEAVTTVHISEPLLDYVQALIAHTRESGEFVTGLSPRAGISLVRAAQAWALMEGHNGVHPEDVKAVFPSVVAHRLERSSDESPTDAGRSILAAVPVP